MEYRTILAANHNQCGAWCECGERFTECFVATVLLPAMIIIREQQYAALFEGV